MPVESKRHKTLQVAVSRRNRFETRMPMITHCELHSMQLSSCACFPYSSTPCFPYRTCSQDRVGAALSVAGYAKGRLCARLPFRQSEPRVSALRATTTFAWQRSSDPAGSSPAAATAHTHTHTHLLYHIHLTLHTATTTLQITNNLTQQRLLHQVYRPGVSRT